MGEIINWNGQQREVVRVKSDCPDHAGYYTTFRDAMQPGEVEYQEPAMPEPAKRYRRKKR